MKTIKIYQLLIVISILTILTAILLTFNHVIL